MSLHRFHMSLFYGVLSGVGSRLSEMQWAGLWGAKQALGQVLVLGSDNFVL